MKVKKTEQVSEKGNEKVLRKNLHSLWMDNHSILASRIPPSNLEAEAMKNYSQEPEWDGLILQQREYGENGEGIYEKRSCALDEDTHKNRAKSASE